MPENEIDSQEPNLVPAWQQEEAERLRREAALLTTRATILVQGNSGTGKSTFAITGGYPIVLAFEYKTRFLAPLINPNAKVVPIDNQKTFENVMERIAKMTTEDGHYERFVVDSFSDLTERAPDIFGISYPLTYSDYGTIGQKALALIDVLQKSCLPTIVICRSEDKEFGKYHRTVPSSLGKSATALPAKCMLTAEARYDERLEWILDTNPDIYAQRSGLPWVPPIWKGTANDYLALIEGRSGRIVDKSERAL